MYLATLCSKLAVSTPLLVEPKDRITSSLGGLAFAVAMAVTTLIGPLGALAQSRAGQGDIHSLINRIDRLQREMNTLQRQVYRSNGRMAPSGPTATGASGEANLAAAMQVRRDEIESQMRSFTGKVEELQHAINSVGKHLDKLASDIDIRLKALESLRPVASGAAPSSGATPAVAAPKLLATPAQPGILGQLPLSELGRQGTAELRAVPIPRGVRGVTQAGKGVVKPGVIQLKGTPEAQYKYAQDLLFGSNYDGAELAFSAFVAAHPKHRLAGNAQYWLGESHYARGNFRKAATIFGAGYQKYPRSTKAPANLLKLGMSLVAINKKKGACDTFKRLLKEHPKASRRVRSRARTRSKKLRCS